MEDTDADHGIKLIIKISFNCIFILASIIGNGSVLYVICKFPKLKTSPNFFVFNLAVADLLFSLTGMVMLLVTSVTGGWVLGDTMCNVGGLLNSVFCSTSIWTLVFISLHRFFAVVKPARAKTLYTKRRTKIMIAGIWAFAFGISSPPLFGWSRFAPGSNFCTVDGRDDMAYSILLLLTDYFFPFLFLTGLYFRIFMVLKKHESAMKIHRIRPQTSLEEVESEIGVTEIEVKIDNEKDGFRKNIEDIYKDVSPDEEKREKTFEMACPVNYSKEVLVTPRIPSKHSRNTMSSGSSKFSAIAALRKSVSRTKSSRTREQRLFREVKVTKMLLIVVCGFFSCWTPFLIASVLYAFNAPLPSDLKLLTIGIMFACLNSIINPIIYAIMNQNFRAAFKETARSLVKRVCSKRKKNVVQIQRSA